MLAKDVALVHNRPTYKISELINRNRKRFKDGIDILDLKSVILPKDEESPKLGAHQNRELIISLLF